MDFQFIGLEAEQFAPLFELSDAQLAARNIVEYKADADRGYPCRVSLRDARKGTRLLLLNYQHLPKVGPYQSRHAIFVSEYAKKAELEPNQIPETVASRLVSIRSFNCAQMMLDAKVVQGENCGPIIRQLFHEHETSFVHIHTAMRGCFLASVSRRDER